jgi:hypothetical protein
MRSLIKSLTKKIIHTDDCPHCKPSSIVEVKAKSSSDLIEDELILYNELQRIPKGFYERSQWISYMQKALHNGFLSIASHKYKSEISRVLRGVEPYHDNMYEICLVWFRQWAYQYARDIAEIMAETNDGWIQEDKENKIWSDTRYVSTAISEHTTVKAVCSVSLAILWNTVLDRIEEEME